MSITPQVIKDQEFQVKFRGYDAIEVKAYLELLAEEFFELHEHNRMLAEDIEGLTATRQDLEAERERLQRASASLQGELDQCRSEAQRKEDELLALRRELQEVKAQLDSSRKETELAKEVVDAVEARMKSEQEKVAIRLREEVAAVEARGDQEKEQGRQLRLENEQLQHRLKLVEQQNQELKKGEVDFKTTIVAAQKFSDDLRKRAEEESRAMLDKAREDVELFRRRAQEELANLPLEIERLQNRRMEVREELRAQLNSYLQQLDLFADSGELGPGGDLMELFQTIQLPDGGELESEPLDNPNLNLS